MMHAIDITIIRPAFTDFPKQWPRAKSKVRITYLWFFIEAEPCIISDLNCIVAQKKC